MGELEASQQKELGDIPIAELVADTAEHHLENDVSGDFDKIERCVCPLVERSTTFLAPIHVIAQASLTLQRRNVGRLTVWAGHG